MSALAMTLVMAVLVLAPAPGAAQTPAPAPPDEPDFRVQIWGDAAADFSARVRDYAALRATLEAGLPVLPLAAEPAEIIRSQRALAQKLREARPGVARGHIFSRDITLSFRRGLRPALTTETVVRIMDDNPGEFSVRVDGTYPKERTLSTVPANLLALLPPLPEDIQYRFLGRHLILYDVRANTIIDRMPCAIRCD
jgi:hypothetical protein